MVDWNSPDEVQKDGAAFAKFMHALLGLYIWEFVNSLDFDWAYISGARRFKWPLTFYFAGRYCLLFALIGIAIALNVTVPVQCQALYTYNQVFGNAAIGFASINLTLRTIAVWSQSLYIVVPLVVVILGHWSLLLHGILLKAAWIPGEGCVITETNNKLLAATFIYSMCFDFTVLLLAGLKLGVANTPRKDRSRIVKLIFEDGLIFFIVAFVANLIATIFMLLNLNAVMSIIANVPAAIASTIVACRAVRRLTNYTSDGVERFGSSEGISTLAFSKSGRFSRAGGLSMSMSDKFKPDGVHVQIETQLDTFAAVTDANVPSDASFPRYNAAGRIIKHKGSTDGLSDLEGATPVEEFKRPEFQ